MPDYWSININGVIFLTLLVPIATYNSVEKKPLILKPLVLVNQNRALRPLSPISEKLFAN